MLQGILESMVSSICLQRRRSKIQDVSTAGSSQTFWDIRSSYNKVISWSEKSEMINFHCIFFVCVLLSFSFILLKSNCIWVLAYIVIRWCTESYENVKTKALIVIYCTPNQYPPR